MCSLTTVCSLLCQLPGLRPHGHVVPHQRQPRRPRGQTYLPHQCLQLCHPDTQRVPAWRGQNNVQGLAAITESKQRRDMCTDNHMTPFFFFSSFFPFRHRTSAHQSLSLPMSPATSSPFSSGQSDPPFTSTATSCSSQTLPSSTCLFEPTRVSWRYTSKH